MAEDAHWLRGGEYSPQLALAGGLACLLLCLAPSRRFGKLQASQGAPRSRSSSAVVPIKLEQLPPPVAAAAPQVLQKTVFLVRHGEALHNVKEQEAKRDASAKAKSLGLLKDSEPYAAMLVEARLEVLRDESLMDPDLSPTGRAQALATRAELERLTQGPIGLPEPTSVMVSPLQRTLETASLLFPEHPGISVQPLLRERRTGLPCDEPRPASQKILSRSFSHMDFRDLLEAESPSPPVEPRRTHSASVLDEVEDAGRLRTRTARLSELLGSVEDRVVCVVAHKGYLRELERGPFGRPKATEFSTGEVRVYDVSLGADGSMDASIRYLKGECDADGDACFTFNSSCAAGG